jgi:hypothetical protein
MSTLWTIKRDLITKFIISSGRVLNIYDWNLKNRMNFAPQIVQFVEFSTETIDRDFFSSASGLFGLLVPSILIFLGFSGL